MEEADIRLNPMQRVAPAMSSRQKTLSVRVAETVAKALGKDPTELPPLQHTIRADALDLLFHEGNRSSGAYTVFPYSGVWVLVHSDETIDVFDGFKATSADEDLPDEVSEPSTDDQFLILNVEDERHALHGDELEDVHEIMDEADDSSEAWEKTIEYAQER